MFLTRIAVMRPVTTAMAMLAILVLGLVGRDRLKIDEMPDVEFPFVFISVEYVGASAETMEKVCIKPLEKACNTVEGIKNIESWSRQNVGFVFLEFHLKVDAAVAAQDVKDRTAPVIADLPPEVEKVLIQKFNPTDRPILSLALSSDRYDLAELSSLAEDELIDSLQAVDGVGSVDLVGARPYEVRIEFKPDKMLSADVSLGQLIATLTAGGQDFPAGTMKVGHQAYAIQFTEEPEDPEMLGELIVVTKKEQPVRVKDVARVSYTAAEATSYAYLNGVGALGLDVRKSTGANTTEVADDLYSALDNLRPGLPPGVDLEIVVDDSVFIRDSVHDVQQVLVEGAILCIAVVFLFLVSWRSTVITGLTLPIAVIGAHLAIYAFGFTLNMMTLMALSLSIGLLIDDAIVVRENIVRHLRMGKSHHDASLQGTNEIGLAVLATTFAIIAVFIPVAFMGGIVGRFFYQFGITMAAAVAISLFVSFTLDPTMSAYWYDPQGVGGEGARPQGTLNWLRRVHRGFNRRRAQIVQRFWTGRLLRDLMVAPFLLVGFVGNCIAHLIHIVLVPVYFLYFALFNLATRGSEHFERWFNRTADHYSGAILWVLKHRALTVLVALVVLIGSVAMLGIVGVEFFPTVDRGSVQLRAITPVDSNLEHTEEAARGLEQICRALPETELTYVTVGGGTASGREASIYVKLKPRHERERSAQQLEEDLRVQLAGRPGMEIAVGGSGMGPGGKTIQIYVSGNRLDELDRLSMEVMRQLATIQGAVEISRTDVTGVPSLEVQLADYRASRLEYTAAGLAQTAYAAIAGLRVSSWQDPDGLDHDVVLRLPLESRQDVAALGRIPIEARFEGEATPPEILPLSQVAEISVGAQPSEIQHRNLQRRITVAANVEGVPSGSVIRGASQFIAQMDLPPGYEIVQGGEAEMIAETMQNVGLALVLAVIFIYFILASQFESFIHPLAIMLSLPLSIIGVVVMLLLTGDTFNIMSMVGLILLMGLVTKNAILLVEFTNQLRRRGFTRMEAQAQAGRIRLRPIIMTTLAMIFGMVPLALALGEGGEFRAPMARAVIGGLITSTILTLFVIPVAYSILDDLFSWLKVKTAGEELEVPADQIPPGDQGAPSG